ncbi:hypothetical protein [Martelella sp. HB161492]|uniref:hypothetical protein n=1 Tax=Martelella sp. HB161492 TaxID=2720726 RepID=UPI00158FE2C5|nr:hypothetical protein [Martelella sp. HB161492]
MAGFLEVIHRAVTSGAINDSLLQGEPGAGASNVEPAADPAANEKDRHMSDDKTPPGAAKPAADADMAAMRKEAADAAKARIKAITTSAEADGRSAMASHLAFDTDMSADAAIALMATAPKGDKVGAPKSYEQQRAADPSGLAKPVAGGKPAEANDDLNPATVYSRRAAVNKGA